MSKKQAPDFEAQIQRLQAIVQELEKTDLPLERSVALYKEGHALSLACKALLEQAKHEVMLCTAQGTEPFTAAISSESFSSDGTP